MAAIGVRIGSLVSGPIRSRTSAAAETVTAAEKAAELPIALSAAYGTLEIMTHAFTPATERALQAAARYGSSSELGLPQVLLGLLDETECFAATLLSERQIDRQAVLARFPDLSETSDDQASGNINSPLLEMAVAAVSGQCADIPLPYELATEHILLGMLLVGSDVAEWLAATGLDAASVEQRIRSRYVSATPKNTSPVSDEPLNFPEESSGETRRVKQRKPKRHDRPGREHLCGAPGGSQIAAWRAIDASANRAREGLRVVEDYVRFALDDRHLTRELKRLRHDLATLLATLPRERLFAARDTLGDVGTQISTSAEFRREDLNSILAANFLRAIEALRSLEEFSKFVAPEAAPQFEQLRYRAYTLERAIAVTGSSLQRLQQAQLYVLIDGRESADDCERFGRELVAAGAHVLQLRAKQLDDRELLQRARRLRHATAGTSTLLIINDRPDLAALVDADGVHLGQEDLSVREARAIVGPASLIGVSTHSIEQARQAVVDGANYIGVRPTFPSTTKSFATFTGLELLRAVADEIRLPAFAIGGISLANLRDVQEAGFSRVAVSGAIGAAADPAEATRQFVRQLGSPPASQVNPR